jgi:hypothetical protein
VPILSPFGNELIKYKLREELDVVHENQNYGASQGIQASIQAIMHTIMARLAK